ncbi:MAG: radical SAM protein [Cyanobacteria bacterium SIG29]|nr:radical SAM protein [Cyanobacteria bacterium SIG29]
MNYCCEFLLHEIAFYKNTIRPCCSFSIEGDITPFVNNYNGEIDKIQEYFSKRDAFIEKTKQNIALPCFNNCTIFESPRNSDYSTALTNIIISNRTKCSCNCIYCEQAAFGENEEFKKQMNQRKPYDIKPILEYLKNNNYIAPNCRFLICGGECSEYPEEELKWLVYFILFHKGHIMFLSSGLNYSKEIECALKTSDSVLKISVDSGTKETYEKIKRIKAYDRVWNNIKRYVSAIEEYDKGRVDLKYILIPGVNDNEEEIDAFLEKCTQVNCKSIVLDVEHRWLSQNKSNLENFVNIKHCLNYFFRNSQKKQIFVSIEGVEEPFLWSFVDKEFNYK